MENALLAAAGLAVGLILAAWSAHVLRALIPSQVASYVVAPRPSWRSFPWQRWRPSWRCSRQASGPRGESRAWTRTNYYGIAAAQVAHRHHRRSYAALIVLQIALALPLLSGAALLARSAWRLKDSNYVIQHYVGFDPARVVVSQVAVNTTPGTRIASIRLPMAWESDSAVFGASRPLLWSRPPRPRAGQSQSKMRKE